MNLLASFAPFFAFAILIHLGYVEAALWAGAAMAAALLLRDRLILNRSFKILEVGTLVLFTGLAVYTRITGQIWTIPAVRLVVDTGLLGIGAIGQTIAKMSEAASTVAAAAEQQGQASQEIAQAIANAAAEARTISESIASVRAAAVSNEAQAATVWDGANRVAESAESLQAAIGTFLQRVLAA